MSSSPVKYGVVGLVRDTAPGLPPPHLSPSSSRHQGIMGTPIARNLMKLGHPVVVWNRSLDKCAPLLAEGATQGKTPADVAAQCDITFAMLSDPEAAEAVALGPGGVVEALTPGKGYVDMSTVDADTSRRIAAAVEAKGARFLEAPVSGSKQPAIGALLHACK
jgi:3-hydroxyisobutyrate dehydrogenase-like beta-hydroxyacid dehydrogenase